MINFNDRFYEKFYKFQASEGIVILPKEDAHDTWVFLKQLVESKLDRLTNEEKDPSRDGNTDEVS